MQAVVGAAVVRRGRVLATRRTAPPELAGRWELPGGKVEAGESPADAVEREVAEELRCRVEVTGWLAGSAPIGTTHVLSVATARLVSGEPDPVEHDQVRWLAAEDLGAVDWLEPDRPFLAELAAVLRAGEAPSRRAGLCRAVLFEEDDARAVQARLLADGYAAELVREVLAGEDDDEDHPWAVLSDAPQVLLEVLVDEHDGWLDLDQPGGQPAAMTGPAPPRALELPTQPRRLKRPDHSQDPMP